MPTIDEFFSLSSSHQFYFPTFSLGDVVIGNNNNYCVFLQIQSVICVTNVRKEKKVQKKCHIGYSIAFSNLRPEWWCITITAWAKTVLMLVTLTLYFFRSDLRNSNEFQFLVISIFPLVSPNVLICVVLLQWKFRYWSSCRNEIYSDCGIVTGSRQQR